MVQRQQSTNRIKRIGQTIYQNIYKLILPIPGTVPEENQKSVLLNIMILISLSACFAISTLFLFIPVTGKQDYIIPVAIAFSGLAISYAIYRNKKITIAAWSTNLTILLAISVGILFAPISEGLAAVSLLVAITISALTISGNVAVVISLVAGGISLLALLTEWQNGTFQPIAADTPALVNWALTGVNFFVIAILLRQGSGALWETQNELRAVNNELKQTQGNLRGLVVERTRDLQLAARIGNQISRIRDVDSLLTEAVQVIESSFELYHTQIYLTDSTGRSLALKASAGEAGQKLIQQGHRLTIGHNSINGLAASKKTSIVEEDTRSEDSKSKPNPLLSETHSELAVPMVVNEQLIGVLNVQSNKTGKELGGLSDDNISVFETIANQLAIAIENANLFVQLQRTQEEITAQARRLTQSGWQSFLDSVEEGDRLRYTYNLADITPKLDDQAESLNNIVFATPIEVSNTRVGVIQVENDPEFSWSQDDTELVQAIAGQVAQKIENLRLLNDANRYRREAEQSLRRLTRENWDNYLETTAPDRLGYIYDGINIQEQQKETKLAPRYNVKPLVIQGESIGELSTSEVEVSQNASNEIMTAVAQSLSTHIETLRLAEQTEQRVIELDLINQINDVVKSNFELETMVKHVGQLIQSAFNSGSATIGIISTDRQSMTFPFFVSKNSNDELTHTDGIVAPIGDGISWEIATKNKPILLNKNTLDEFEEAGAVYVAPDNQKVIQHFLGVPMTAGNEALGILTIQNYSDQRPFTLADKNLLVTLGSSIGIGIRNAQLFRQTQTILAETEALYNASTAFNRAQTIKDVLSSFGQALGQYSDVDGAAFWELIYDARHALIGIRIKSVWRPAGQPVRLQAGTPLLIESTPSIQHWITDAHDIHLLDNITTTPQTQQDKAFLDLCRTLEMVAFALVPMTIGKRRIGLLSFYWNEERRFTDRDTRQFSGLAAQAATSIDSLLQLERSEQRARQEQLVNAITQKIQETSTIENALQMTVQELGKGLNLRKARIRLNRENEQNGQGQ